MFVDGESPENGAEQLVGNLQIPEDAVSIAVTLDGVLAPVDGRTVNPS